MLAAMQLAGIRIPDDDIRELVGLIDEPLAARLVTALERQVVILGLTISEREEILRALDDPQTTPLAELRATLPLEHEWRVREGLV